MTISNHITEQTNRLDLEFLTPKQKEWLHSMRNLAMLAYIAQVRRELAREAIHE